MFNYQDLSDVEFEHLAQDIMERKLKIRLHRFGKGVDGGIDLVDDTGKRDIVVQVKHYIKTPFSGLLSSLRKELPKVKKLSPKQYYVVCSCTLTPDNTQSIYKLFEDYMDSSHNIVCLTDIDDFLSKRENEDIVQQHYKLWLHSTTLLTNIVSQNVFVDSQVLLASMQKNKKKYVATSAYETAKEVLLKKRVLMIIGAPGVGKTITSEMLAAFFAAQQYHIRYTTDGEDINSLKRSLSGNQEQKEFILLDDCFGQCYFKMKETQDNEIMALIRYVSMSPNKVLLMNSRVTIFNEVESKSPTLYKEISTGELKVNILDMTRTSLEEKGKIFYNHLYFSGLSSTYFDGIRENKNYRKIVSHRNYSPRIIEFATLPSVEISVPSSAYFNYIMTALDKPEGIWEDEFSRRLQPADRILLTTIYSLTETTVDIDLLRKCYNYRLSLSTGVDHTIDNWTMSLKRLNESFVKIIDVQGRKMISVVNPSVNDFLCSYLTDDCPEKGAMTRSIISVRQARRLLEKPDDFLRAKLEDGSIMEFVFENDKSKDDFIIYGICKYEIKNVIYSNIVEDYLEEPHTLMAQTTGVNLMYSSNVLICLLEPELCRFYSCYKMLQNEEWVDSILEDVELEEFVEMIQAVDAIFPMLKIQRKDFLAKIQQHMYNVFGRFAEDIDAADASDGIDIYTILRENVNYSDGTIDEWAAEDELNDLIIESFKSELTEMISVLPKDIRDMVDLESDIYYSVSGSSSVIDSYLVPDVDMDEYRYGKEDNHSYGENEFAELDYLFDRDYNG